jgi:hypothetical protein
MYEKFKEIYPQRRLTQQQILNDLKSKKIVYKKSLRGPESIQGCFINVRFKLNGLSSNANKSFDFDEEPYYEDLYNKLNVKYRELELELKRLKETYEPVIIKKEEVKIKKEEVKIKEVDKIKTKKLVNKETFTKKEKNELFNLFDFDD